jgi:hypothetical protein
MEHQKLWIRRRRINGRWGLTPLPPLKGKDPSGAKGAPPTAVLRCTAAGAGPEGRGSARRQPGQRPRATLLLSLSRVLVPLGRKRKRKGGGESSAAAAAVSSGRRRRRASRGRHGLLQSRHGRQRVGRGRECGARVSGSRPSGHFALAETRAEPSDLHRTVSKAGRQESSRPTGRGPRAGGLQSGRQQ